jgi:hypothetical protein
VHDFVDTARRHVDGLGKRVLADVQRLEPFFQQDFAGMDEGNFAGWCCSFNGNRRSRRSTRRRRATRSTRATGR